jgi:hypothetical protein
MTPYLQGQKAYLIDRFTYEMNPYLKDTSIAEKLAFETWTRDAQDWYIGWRDAAIGISTNGA